MKPVRGDNEESSLHFSARLDQYVVGCVSFIKNEHPRFKNKFPYQLRGMAVSQEHRGLNIGTQLLSFAESYIKSNGENFIWCNVRQSAIPFYEKQGFFSLGSLFEIKAIGPHLLMFKNL